MEMRGFLVGIGIIQGKPFSPNQRTRALLDKAAKTATHIDHIDVYTPNAMSLSGDNHYKLHLPPNIAGALFWSVRAYDPITASGLDREQPFPSLNIMDKPVMNPQWIFTLAPSLPARAKTTLPPFQKKGCYSPPL